MSCCPLFLLPFLLLLPLISVQAASNKSKINHLHMNVDIAETNFNFRDELLEMDCVITLAWTEGDHGYLPLHEEFHTFQAKEEIFWGIYWNITIPDIRRSMEEDEHRKSYTEMSEVTLFKNGTIELQFFYTAIIPCGQSSLLYPWDEFHCGVHFQNTDQTSTMSPYHRKEPFSIAYSRPQLNHRIKSWYSKVEDRMENTYRGGTFYVRGFKFDCIVQRVQSRVIYTNVIPTIAIIFFDAYIYISNQTPFYCMLTIVPLLLQLEFFSDLLANKLPYFAIFLIARSILSVLTSTGRLMLTLPCAPPSIKKLAEYDSALNRTSFVILSTFFTYLMIDYVHPIPESNELNTHH